MIEKIEHACKVIIDEMNSRYDAFTSPEETLEKLSAEFNEYDMIFRIAQTLIRDFEGDVRFPIWRKSGMLISFDGNSVQTKFWRNWRGYTEIPRPKNWKESFQTVFDWLDAEISSGQKNNRAIIAIWPTAEAWKYLLQFGGTTGANPKVNQDKLDLFPFLKSPDKSIASLVTDYTKRESTYKSSSGNTINVRLIGSSTDVLNMAIFW